MKTKPIPRVAVNERRAYFECHVGQLHVRTAFPSTGGFDERTPLIFLHDAAATSLSFAGLIAEMATDRSIYAVDLPGHGETDPATKGADLTDYAAVVGDLIGGLRLREIDVVGQGFGAAVAAELAALKDAVVQSLVLIDAPTKAADGVPQWTPNESGDGLSELYRAIRARGPEREPLENSTLRFVEILRGAAGVAQAGAVLAAWPATERWRQVRHRTLAVDLGRRRPAVVDLLPVGRSLDGSALPGDALRIGNANLAARLRAFLDAPQ
jgi:pimeloyl-ACP methyl ester carboxylesterase